MSILRITHHFFFVTKPPILPLHSTASFLKFRIWWQLYTHTCTVKGTCDIYIYIYIYPSFWPCFFLVFVLQWSDAVQSRRNHRFGFWKFNSEKGRREMGKVEILFKWIQFCGSFSLCIYSRESYIDVPSILYYKFKNKRHKALTKGKTLKPRPNYRAFKTVKVYIMLVA